MNRLVKRVNKVVFAISIRFPAKILFNRSTLDAKNAEITASQKQFKSLLLSNISRITAV